MRYCPPGVQRRPDKWTADEKAAFARTLLVPTRSFVRLLCCAEALSVVCLQLHPLEDDKWGLFSLHLPGRTGQQCHSLFAALTASGELLKDLDLSCACVLSALI